MSFWERHKAKIYHYGHIYATLYGLKVINYIPARPTNTWTHRLTVLYSHVVGALLIVVCPVYFVSHCDALLETKDRRQQLQLVVNFANTLIKYVTVVVTYGANLAQYTAMREITKTRQQLEDAFEGSTLGNAQSPFDADVTESKAGITAWTEGRIRAGHFGGAAAGRATSAPTEAATRVRIAAGSRAEADDKTEPHCQRPRQQFERMLLFKFGLINAMMLLQVASILYQHYGLDSQPLVRLQYAVYAFVLWNYTENMADYFYFINCSALRFYRQLRQQLQQLLRQAHSLRARSGGYAMELCNQLCDRLDELAARCQQIQRLYGDGVRMQQFQILGLIFTALISNLTNFFSLFNLFSKHALDQASPEIALSLLHAFVFYVDTYIVTLISDHISGEKAAIGSTMQRFNGIAGLDVRLEQTIERFTLQLLHSKADVRICGFFSLNRHLAFLTAAAGFSYFITLVQFDLSFY